MQQAIKSAIAGIEKGQTPFGACIVKDGVVLARSHNKVWKNKDITAHAEVEVIRKVCKKLQTVHLPGTTIYSTCEPCPMCFSACHWAGISRIVYGAGIADAEKSGFRELRISNSKMLALSGSPMKITKHILRDACVDLFDRWRRSAKSQTY
ncbi:nucleoside deaminase [bacterium]|nr:nucleoside deaminase [bacterium]